MVPINQKYKCVPVRKESGLLVTKSCGQLKRKGDEEKVTHL